MEHETSFKSIELKVAGSNVSRYTILEQLGKGGMGCVYKAMQVSTGRPVAIKVISETGDGASDKNAQRFRAELEAIARMSHPNVVSVIDFDTDDSGRPFIVMEYLEGDNLSDLIRKKGRIDYRELFQLLIAVCNGLAHAHSKGIIHRDLKPSNIMVSTDSAGQTITKIVDFGVAKNKAIVDNDSKPTLTQTGEIIGSPVYMSPEQCMGYALDQRSDIYSLGCIIFEGLTGQLPFEGETAMEVILQRLTNDPRRINQVAPGLKIPDAVQIIVSKTLEKDAANRYSNIEELRSDLEAVLQDRKVRAESKSITNQKKGRNLAMVVVGTALLLVGGVFAFREITASKVAPAVVETKKQTSSPGISKPSIISKADPLTAASELEVVENDIIQKNASHNYKGVQILLRKAIQLSTEVRGANNASTIERLLQLGDYYRNIDVNYADSAKLYSEAAERFRKAYGDNESVLAEQIKLRSGIAASLSHDYKEAVLLLEQANKLALRLCPADQVDESATWLATVVSDSGDHLRAAHIWEANAQYVAIHMGKNSFEMGASIHGAGEQYLKAGDKKSAVRLLKQAVSIFEHCSNQIFLETAKQNLRIAES